ncbi:hypothetical protein LINGRAHAP2_LOCUS25049 [Linum grandiflorum]
MHLFYTPD